MDDWVVKALLNTSSSSSWSQEEQMRRMKTSIYKVPPSISNINEKAYQPRVVSFGPYHHEEPHLALMEVHKKRTLVRRIHQSGRSWEDLICFVGQKAQDLMGSYDFLDPRWQGNTEKFVQLMILDGCFMLEVLEPYFCEVDPVFGGYEYWYLIPLIRADMLLLENQLSM